MTTARKKPPAKKAPSATPAKRPARTKPILQSPPPIVLDVELSGGNTARLRDPATMTNGERRPIAIAAEEYNQQQLDPQVTRELARAIAQNNEERKTELMAALQLDADESGELAVADVLITVLVEAWSLELPLPSTAPKLDEDGMLIGSDVLDDLLAWDYDALRWATARLLPTLRRGPGEPQSRPT